MPDFAARKRIEQHADLEKDFTNRILELPWAFISDELSLWDFHSDLTNDNLVRKILATYGVDVPMFQKGTSPIFWTLSRENPDKRRYRLCGFQVSEYATYRELALGAESDLVSPAIGEEKSGPLRNGAPIELEEPAPVQMTPLKVTVPPMTF